MFGWCGVFMCLVFVLDILTDSTIRLHNLYVLPLVLIVIHCPARWMLRTAFVASILFQMVVLWTEDMSNVSRMTEMTVALGISLITITLATAVRDNHNATAILATTDPLTGLLNRRSFDNVLEREFAHQARYGCDSTLALFDLDSFKELNDQKGHAAGDLALQIVATVLRNHSRETDAVARLGGDEFAVLMSNTSTTQCEVACTLLSKHISKALAEAGFDVTASVGWSSIGCGNASITETMQRADAHMYANKRSAR